MKSSFLFRTIVAITSLMVAVCGTRAELMVGDKAPKLRTGKWIQGEPVRSFDSNHVYVVEFWATWCGPCVGSIPHLNALWQKFKNKGVIVIGQDIWDSDAAVAPFVKKMGAKMTYRVALDHKGWFDHEGFMAEHWWKRGTNYHGIPTAFIINREGRIAWIGHPMALKEKVLNDIVSGHYDLAKATVEYKKEREANKKLQALQRKLFSDIHKQKWDAAGSILNEILAAFPKSQNYFSGVRLQILLGQKKYDEAYQFANSLSDAHPNDSDTQNYLAWNLVTQDWPLVTHRGAEQRILKLAKKFAERADESTGGTNAAILDTLARVQFMSGKTNEAVAIEQRALKIAPERRKIYIEKVLADYRHGFLPKDITGFR